MTYADALSELRGGQRVARAGWPDYRWLTLDPQSFALESGIRTRTGDEWTPDDDDHTATDWEVV